MVLCARVAGKYSLNTMTAWCHLRAAASCENQLQPKIWEVLQIRNPIISAQAVLCDIEPMLYDCIPAVRLKNTGLGSDVNVCFCDWCALSAGSAAHAVEHIKCLVLIRTGYVSSARLYIYIVVI